MNIFVLDTDVQACARAHYDRHVVKMCLEYAQILSTAARLRGFEHDGYRSTHQNHPCVCWAAEEPRNWAWLYRLAQALGSEYSDRYGRVHASTLALQSLPTELSERAAIRPDVPFNFVLAMPEEFQGDDPVEAYRAYYRKGKAHLIAYRAPAVVPSWLH